MNVYAGCLDGDEALWNARLEAAFGETKPDTEEPGDSPGFAA